MSPDKQHAVEALFGLAIVYLFWRLKEGAVGLTFTPAPEGPTNPQDAFTAPYQTTNPGISDSSQLLNGGNQAFQSVVNVNVNPDLAQFLNNHYIPLFGFVGATTIVNTQDVYHTIRTYQPIPEAPTAAAPGWQTNVIAAAKYDATLQGTPNMTYVNGGSNLMSVHGL